GLAFLPASVLVGVAAVIVAAPWLRRVPRLSLRPVRRAVPVCAALTACVGWSTAGTAVWLLLHAILPAAPSLSFATGAYALSWLTGFLLPFAPSGLGAREATLIALLAPSFGIGPAALVAVVIRFANIVGDLLAVAA